jgi:hypothetical protein
MNPSENARTGTSLFVTVMVAALAGIIAGGSTTYLGRNLFGEKIKFTTPYQAVQLNNGSAYFCKIEGLGTRYPILRELYFIQSQQNPETKQVSNTLLKRGNEWWQPDQMIVNANDIVSIEPVSPNSRVAELIEEAKEKR